jgi:hypothetical protein
MSFVRLLKLPFKKTVLIIVTSAALSLVFSFLVIYIDRVVNSNSSVQCGDITYCLVHTNLIAGIAFSALNDFAVITRYIFELSVAFLLVQVVYRIKKHH